MLDDAQGVMIFYGIIGGPCICKDSPKGFLLWHTGSRDTEGLPFRVFPAFVLCNRVYVTLARHRSQSSGSVLYKFLT